MTVCMGYTATTPTRASRKTPPEGGRKAMQGERLNTNKFSEGDIAYEEEQI